MMEGVREEIIFNNTSLLFFYNKNKIIISKRICSIIANPFFCFA